MEKLRTTRLGRRLLSGSFPYLMVAPAMVFLAIFTFYPMANMVYLSFFDYDMMTPKKYVGLRNYRRLLFENIDFWPALKNTAVYSLAVVVCLILFAIMFACWFQKSTKLNALAQRVMFFPHLCATLTVSMVFQWLMSTEGLFNVVLNFFNLPGLRWLNDSSTALLSIVIVSVWKGIGYYALILLSSLKAIPSEINEAAALDDAGPITKFFKITIPMLSPQLFFLLITITINSFKVFDSVNVLTKGGPGQSTQVLVYYIYKQAFTNAKVGYASAAGTMLVLILVGLTILYFRSFSRKVHYQ